jgi:hypothetical protein
VSRASGPERQPVDPEYAACSAAMSSLAIVDIASVARLALA